MFGRSWDPKRNMPDLTGKVAVVTGGNTGIGKEIVRELALHNARVVYMASRTESRALAAIEEMKTRDEAIKKADNVKFLKLDLADLKSCREAANAILEKEDRLDILINNAGIMATPYEITADGFELQFQSNHLGHFAFTIPLLPLLIKTSKDPNTSVRIVQVSSHAHFFATKSQDIKFDTIESVNRDFGPWKRYGQSKLANILFAKELSERLKDERIFSNATHPGSVNTELNRGIMASYPYLPLKPLVWAFGWLIKTPYQGATTPLYAATATEIEEKNWRGEYFVPMAQLSKPNELAQDAQLAKDLWAFSERVLEEKLGDVSS